MISNNYFFDTNDYILYIRTTHFKMSFTVDLIITIDVIDLIKIQIMTQQDNFMLWYQLKYMFQLFDTM